MCKQRIAKTALAFALSGLFLTAQAGQDLQDLARRLSRVGNKQGWIANHNLTTPSIVQSQQSGFMTGGGLFLRSPNKTLHPIHITPPHISAGCGGVDIVTGGLSYIKLPALAEFGKTIIKQAPSYAAKLALQTLSPMVANTMSELQAVAQKFNAFQINSCQIATQMVDSIALKASSNYHTKCIDRARATGAVDNLADAMVYCQTHHGNFDQNAKNRNDNKKRMMGDFTGNIVWKIIQQNMPNADHRLRQELISMTGTLIAPADPTQPPVIKAPLAVKKEFIQTLVLGTSPHKKMELYQCKDACLLMPKIQVESFGTIEAVRKGLFSIFDNIEKDTPLTPIAKELMRGQALPIYPLAVESVTLGGARYAELFFKPHLERIAFQLLRSRFHDLRKQVWLAIQEDTRLSKTARSILRDNFSKVDLAFASVAKTIQANQNQVRDAMNIHEFLRRANQNRS